MDVRQLPVILILDRKAALEARARLKTEYFIELELDDEVIDCLLAMLALHFGQNQLGRSLVVKPAKVRTASSCCVRSSVIAITADVPAL